MGTGRGGGGAEGRRPRGATAMSTAATPSYQPLWNGEDVTVRQVLDALSEVRAQFARDVAGDDEHAHPRNCVMTLIRLASTPDHERIANRTTESIGSQHPVQAIVSREYAPLRVDHVDDWQPS